MHTISKTAGLAALATSLASLLLAGTAQAGNMASASDYNHAYGQNAGQENAVIDPSLRDANGNLTVVDGQFTSSAYSRSNASSSSSANAWSSGVGSQHSTYGSATAIANSLNVITVGSWNTVVVNSHQTNNGDVKADVKLNK